MTRSNAVSGSMLGVASYAAIKQHIVRGRLKPATRLVEIELCEKLGVSRTPLRAALHRLEQDGLVEVYSTGRRQMYRVTPLSAEDALDVYGLMGALEGAVARRVSALEPKALEQMAVELEGAGERFEACLLSSPGKRSNALKLSQLHDEFHAVFVDRLSTPRLKVLLDQIRPSADRYEWIYARDIGVDTRDDTIREHRAIVQALSAGNPVAAFDAVNANWVNGGYRLAQLIPTTEVD